MSAIAEDRLLKPEVLARLGSLDLIARTVVEGVSHGLHRSPHFGFSQEFAEYRAYNEGDDLRYVDWNVYARTDRTYIKRFEGETNTAVTLLLDASASMGFGTPVSKLQQAQFLIASLAYTVRRQHDALGLAVFDDAVREFLAPSSRPDSLPRVLGVLQQTKAGSGTGITEALQRLQANLTRRGLVILVSDFYMDLDALSSALQPLASGGHDLAVFHVLDQEEITPSMKTISALEDLETKESVVVDPAYLADEYRQRFSAHCEALQRSCQQLGADYTRVLTTDPLDSALQEYLQFRERRGR